MPSVPVETGPTRFLPPNGGTVKPLPEPFGERATLVALYRWMTLTRFFDAKAVALQRTGRLGTYASSLGQEASPVGVAWAMRPEDALAPSFREHGAQLLRGVTPLELFLYWGGDERGSDFAGPRHDFPVCATVGAQAPHAAGAALAFKLRGEARAAVCLLGDGATSKGDVYEAMNMAGTWALPLVFVVINNQWAISTPRSVQTAASRLADKALATGFPGRQVDGNDVVAVAYETSQALERARGGDGPGLLECLTYRLADHTTVDDASRYRDPAEVEAHRGEDPLERLRAYLTNEAGWTAAEDEALREQCQAEIEEASDAWLASPAPDPGSMFDSLFAAAPREIARQRGSLLELLENGRDA